VSLPPTPRTAARRIGLLGGSFNPAHRGHLHVSLAALRRLGLDEVWWLVSPQNPLKSGDGMASLGARLTDARALARHPRIRVSALEEDFGTRYTVDTLEALRRRWPRLRFVWLMGADILIQLPRWKRWRRMLTLAPIAVFDRPGYGLRALAGPAAARNARFRLPEARIATLPDAHPPAWAFLHGPLDWTSATELRARRADRP
jgi:nicotinate-nucleotide adenylyltransferase